MKISLTGLDTSETEEWIRGLGLDAYRARQIRQWLFAKLAGSFEEMTNLPKPMRNVLAETARINHIQLKKTQVSKDGTKKFLFELEDGNAIETVLIPERDHDTICLSSQAGCAMGCRFCLTAKQGFRRNLTPSEIVEQVINVKKTMDSPDKLKNIVFMGMGEPLENYASLVKAITILMAEDGMNFSHRKLTVSTCGLVPNIKKMGREITVNLAVSLNAADNGVRDFLMPINRKYPLEALISACHEFPLPNRRMITFEYILIKGINDRNQDAKRLCHLLKGLRAKINLIPVNSHAFSDFKAPESSRIQRFQEILINNHYTAIIRKSKGEDIMAACGQLTGSSMGILV